MLTRLRFTCIDDDVLSKAKKGQAKTATVTGGHHHADKSATQRWIASATSAPPTNGTFLSTLAKGAWGRAWGRAKRAKKPSSMNVS